MGTGPGRAASIIRKPAPLPATAATLARTGIAPRARHSRNSGPKIR